ncbi:MAG: hypothetical protein IPK26_00170 [Planctomycetes bacterium]|nr:hypothetical protein [Planctomycetota bacterium]
MGTVVGLFGVALALAAGPQDPLVKATAELRRVVALPDAKARAAAVPALARGGLTPAQWLAVLGSADGYAARDAGPSEQKIDLGVTGEAGPTFVYLYTPPKYDPGKPAPLLLWCHGAGGSGAQEHQRWQTFADQLGMFVLALTDSSLQGYTFAQKERDVQLAALRWARQQVHVDDNAIFVGGISRGGHQTWDLVLRHPDLWAGAIPCIGGPRLQNGAGNNLRFLENVVQLPIRDLQGMQDDPLLIFNLKLAFGELTKLKAADAQLVEFADRGHDFDLTAVDWAPFFGKRRRPVPERVVRRAVVGGEMRALWVEILTVDPACVVEPKIAVDPARWNKLDDAGQRRFLHEKITEKTARLEVTMTAPGRFVAKGTGIRKFRLLLTAAMVGADGTVEVQWAGKAVRKKVAPDATVLLRDFVERLDRSFLPVHELLVGG